MAGAMLPYPALGFVIAMGSINPTHHTTDLFIDGAHPSIVAEKSAEASTKILTCWKSVDFTNMMHLLL
jgi:hypothetical protein